MSLVDPTGAERVGERARGPRAHRAVLIAAAVLVGAGLGACESTQTQSARLEKTGKAKAQTSVISAGAANTAVKVLSRTVLHSETGNAAVVELENTGAASEVQVPILITVTDAQGQVSYKNDIDGLQPSLQQMAFLARGQKAYWVNDQVLAVDPPKGIEVEVGKEQATFSGPVPRITVEAARLDRDSTGAYATGEVRNRSRITQLNLPIFAVALKDGKVVAAGRGIVEKLLPAPTRKPVHYKIFFIGDPRGASLEVTAAPTVLREGAP